jgi:hypothetical protein
MLTTIQRIEGGGRAARQRRRGSQCRPADATMTDGRLVLNTVSKADQNDKNNRRISGI